MTSTTASNQTQPDSTASDLADPAAAAGMASMIEFLAADASEARPFEFAIVYRTGRQSQRIYTGPGWYAAKLAGATLADGEIVNRIDHLDPETAPHWAPDVTGTPYARPVWIEAASDLAAMFAANAIAVKL